MIYYKQFHLDSFTVIKSKSQHYFQTRSSFPAGFTLLDKKEFLSTCPELETDLKKYDIEIKNIGVYVTYTQEQSKVHIDYINPNWNQCRLNIPVLNTEGSTTEFYTGGKYKEIVQTNGLGYLESIDDSAIKVDEVELISPTILRIQSPHRVNTNTTTVPRICLTIFTSKDMVSFM
jgi:hypothetical protein